MNILLFGLIISYILLFFSSNTLRSQLGSQSMSVLSGEVAPIGGQIPYYTFSVAEEAVNPRLVGQYNVLDVETILVDVLEQEGCPTPLSPFECTAIFSSSEQNHGNVDLGLKPGKAYYLEFENNESLSGLRTTHVDFYVQYQSNRFLSVQDTIHGALNSI